jgi:manganese efflux pump family protein
MAIAALLTWLVTAVLGFTMLGMWLRGGGIRAASAQSGTSASGGASASAGASVSGGASASGGATAATTRFAPGVVLGHFVIAAAGLLVWIWYLVTDIDALTWVAFILLVVVAVLGEVLFLRWFRNRGEATVESHLPKPVVYTHGVFAVVTAVLVLLVALGVGGS